MKGGGKSDSREREKERVRSFYRGFHNSGAHEFFHLKFLSKKTVTDLEGKGSACARRNLAEGKATSRMISFQKK